MVLLALRRVGNSVGLILPAGLLKDRGLSIDDLVDVAIEPVPSLEEVAGSLRGHGLTVDEWNAATNEGEEL